MSFETLKISEIKKIAEDFAVDTDGLKNKAAWRVACRLYDLGQKAITPKPVGSQPYPLEAVKRYQKQIGIKPERQDGLPNKATWINLFGKDKP